MLDRLIVEKGKKIVCPECKRDIAIVLVDIVSGTRLMAGLFQGIDCELIDGQKTICPSCCANYTRGGIISGLQIHTEDGWK